MPRRRPRLPRLIGAVLVYRDKEAQKQLRREETLRTEPQSTWLNAAEAAAYWRLPSEKALYAVRRAQIKAYRRGRRLRFRVADLDAAMTRAIGD